MNSSLRDLIFAFEVYSTSAGVSILLEDRVTDGRVGVGAKLISINICPATTRKQDPGAWTNQPEGSLSHRTAQWTTQTHQLFQALG